MRVHGAPTREWDDDDGPHGRGRSARRQTFASLFASSAGAFRAIAAGVLGRVDGIDDVLQESALIGYRKFDQFERGTSFTAWMGQIVRYTALNMARRRSRSATRPAGSDGLAEVTAHAAPPPAAVVGADGTITAGREAFDDNVLRALQQLEETPRLCLLLRVLEQAPYREIARMLDIPEGTAMSHVHRSRRMLRNLLSGHDADDPPRRDLHSPENAP